MTGAPLGAIIAGGRSTRYGEPKALVDVGGMRVVDRVAAALRAVVAADDLVVIANDNVLAEAIGLPYRSDVLQDAGALAGVHAALVWARDRGRRGIIAAACDMPFLNAALLREIDARATADAVLPESTGPRGVEPLCAYYGVRCIAAIEDAAARGDARMIGFLADVNVERVPLPVVQSCGDVDVMFRNLNTPADRAEAERLLRGDRADAER